MSDTDPKDTSPSSSEKHDVDGLVKAFFGGKNGLKERATLMRNMDGKDHDTDVLEEDLETALELLSNDMNDNHEEAVKHIDVSLLSSMGKSTKDLYVAYLKWSRKDEEEPEKSLMNDESTTTTSKAYNYNISKAKRRLLNFLTWIEKHYEECVKETVTAEEFAETYSYYNMVISNASRDQYDRIIIWMRVDEKLLKKLGSQPRSKLTRFVYYWTTILSLQETIHSTGVVIVTNWDHASLLSMTKVIDREQKKDLDALSKGASAIKMKKFYILRQTTLMSVLMKLIGFFLSKKLKKRICMLGDDWDGLCRGLFGDAKFNDASKDTIDIFSMIPSSICDQGKAQFKDILV